MVDTHKENRRENYEYSADTKKEGLFQLQSRTSTVYGYALVDL